MNCKIPKCNDPDHGHLSWHQKLELKERGIYKEASVLSEGKKPIWRDIINDKPIDVKLNEKDINKREKEEGKKDGDRPLFNKEILEIMKGKKKEEKKEEVKAKI